MALLTDLGICRAKPKYQAYILKSGRCLSLRIEPNSAKLWHFRFYWQGTQQRISFGAIPDVDLKTARKLCEDARSCWVNGIEPRIYKIIKQAEMKFEGLPLQSLLSYGKHLS